MPFRGYEHLLQRRFEEAIDSFLEDAGQGPNDAISSALAAAYHGLAFQTLADQVRRSVRSVRGNQWMFRMGQGRTSRCGFAPSFCGARPTPIRCFANDAGADGPVAQRVERHFLSGHGFSRRRARAQRVDRSGGARAGQEPRPPVEAYLRVIDEPVLRLVSVDLGAAAEIERWRRCLISRRIIWGC